MNFLVAGEREILDFITDEKHILISIKSPDSKDLKLPSLKSRIATLFLDFHDIDVDRYPGMEINPKITLFTKKQAEEILKFVNNNKNKVDLIVCQCEAGISRSAGVAGALSKIFNNDDSYYFSTYIPNKYVYNTILKCYYNKGLNIVKKHKRYCSCEETRDEFGGCVPKDESMKKCIACGKKISKQEKEKYKQRMLEESGWEEEFEEQYDQAYELIEDDKLLCLIYSYLIPDGIKTKVRIRVRKGCIQIERID